MGNSKDVVIGRDRRETWINVNQIFFGNRSYDRRKMKLRQTFKKGNMVGDIKAMRNKVVTSIAFLGVVTAANASTGSVVYCRRPPKPSQLLPTATQAYISNRRPKGTLSRSLEL
ncbi:hypothetical protein HYC85_029163 [Camellia sinensis]|uniref:Uncharacterized protein n=1 Tax=Camellia sinensis TaxID=4442 RepID=A0A7J7FXA8_CAMSI|nr:hypothetical protein HYC85_029163 [Camellia sinensis]